VWDRRFPLRVAVHTAEPRSEPDEALDLRPTWPAMPNQVEPAPPHERSLIHGVIRRVPRDARYRR
jgi:hypothetical protein